MAREPQDQLKELIDQSEHILLLLPENPSGDAIGAGWAFYFFLEKMKKKATLACSDPFGNIDRFSFLDRPENITDSISGARDFVLAFNTRYNKIIKTRTATEGDEFKIFITPEHGAIDPRDFSFIPAKFKYDLLVTLGCPDKESSGKIYEKDPDIFYEIPMANIDHHGTNDKYAQMNFVNITASSTSEVTTDLLEKLDLSAIDDKIAKCLLAGIISATESFQKKNTTPRALQAAARLIEKGADQQQIVRWLYKTQPLHILKLWGRVMARLKWNEDAKLAWSLVSLEDFVQSRSKSRDLPLILEKIRDNYSSGNIFLVLFHETSDKIRGMVKMVHEQAEKKMESLFSDWRKERSEGIFSFTLDGNDIMEAERSVLEKLEEMA